MKSFVLMTGALFMMFAAPLYAEKSSADLDKAVDTFYSTGCTAESPERLGAMRTVQAALDAITPADYKQFYLRGLEIPADELRGIYEKHPGLHFYDRAFEKVLNEVKTEKVAPGDVVIWLVYNMGYVVKTSKHCFGIDIHHRRAEELVPYLEFLLVTHNHPDHSTLRLQYAMNAAGKKVYSNFFPSYGGYSKEPFRKVQHGDLTVYSYESDHNANLRKFMMPFEIVCGPEESDCVIFSSGDSCNAKQLKPTSKRVDFYLVHPYVGLDVVEAQTTVHPEVTLVSHLQELHHPFDKWRWSYENGIWAANLIRKAGRTAWVPVWGEKIVWHKK